MSIIQTTATIGAAARRRRAPITPREVRPARRQLSGLLICGVPFRALGAILLALGMDANRSAVGEVWALEPHWQGRGSSTRGGKATSCSGSTTRAWMRRSGRPGARCAGCWAPRRWSSPSPWRSLHPSSAMWVLRGVTALLCCGWVATGVALLAH